MSLLGNTLRDVSHESALEKPEKISLRLIAKEVDKVYAENKRLKAKLEKHRWIPVSERLPEIDIVVFLGWAGDDVVLGLRVNISKHEYTHWQNKNGLPITATPTHWKPIILPNQTLKP